MDEITTGQTPFGVRFATLGVYRVVFWPQDESHEAQVRHDCPCGCPPAWRRTEAMPVMIRTALIRAALLAACKREDMR